MINSKQIESEKSMMQALIIEKNGSSHSQCEPLIYRAALMSPLILRYAYTLYKAIRVKVKSSMLKIWLEKWLNIGPKSIPGASIDRMYFLLLTQTSYLTVYETA